MGSLRVIGNIIWLVLAGIWLAIGYLISAVLSVLFIITIPLALPALKLAGYALWPFGRVVVRNPVRDRSLSTLGNVVWFVFAGWWLVLVHLITALALALTVIGIPFALANLKMAKLALLPYGRMVVDRRHVPEDADTEASILELDAPAADRGLAGLTGEHTTEA
ncbi:MAG: YccF domain-containing protein [Actinomycetota bacterium]